MPFMRERRVEAKLPRGLQKLFSGTAGTSPPRGRETRNRKFPRAGLGLLETWSSFWFGREYGRSKKCQANCWPDFPGQPQGKIAFHNRGNGHRLDCGRGFSTGQVLDSQWNIAPIRTSGNEAAGRAIQTAVFPAFGGTCGLIGSPCGHPSRRFTSALRDPAIHWTVVVDGQRLFQRSKSPGGKPFGLP